MPMIDLLLMTCNRLILAGYPLLLTQHWSADFHGAAQVDPEPSPHWATTLFTEKQALQHPSSDTTQEASHCTHRLAVTEVLQSSTTRMLTLSCWPELAHLALQRALCKCLADALTNCSYIFKVCGILQDLTHPLTLSYGIGEACCNAWLS